MSPLHVLFPVFLLILILISVSPYLSMAVFSVCFSLWLSLSLCLSLSMFSSLSLTLCLYLSPSLFLSLCLFMCLHPTLSVSHSPARSLSLSCPPTPYLGVSPPLHHVTPGSLRVSAPRMAPEVVAVTLKGGYNELCDIWSLGITAIELTELQPTLFDVHPLR